MKVKVKSLGPVWLFATPWTVAHQAPPCMGLTPFQLPKFLPCLLSLSLGMIIALSVTTLHPTKLSYLVSPLECKEIQPVHPKGDQSWVFIGRTDAEAETPILWPPHAKSWLIGKDSDAGRDWGQEEKETTEDEMAGWHHRLDGHEFEWTPGVGDGQGGLACCNSWGRKESDMTEWLNWTDQIRSVAQSFTKSSCSNYVSDFYILIIDTRSP